MYIPLFIAIDQEAGKVDRTPGEIHRLKNVYDVSKTDPVLIKDHAKVVGKILGPKIKLFQDTDVLFLIAKIVA